MNRIQLRRILVVVFASMGIVMAPVAQVNVSAQEQGSSTGGVAAGVDVTGPPEGTGPSGKGALAPPPKKKGVPQEKTPPVKQAEQKEVPRGIGASAGPVGPASAKAGSGISMGWKIAGGVLGLGLLIGLAGGGGGGGGGTTSGHE